MNISNLGRLIGAGLLALLLHAFAPGGAANNPDRLELGAASGSTTDNPTNSTSAEASGRQLPPAKASKLSPASGTRPTANPG